MKNEDLAEQIQQGRTEFISQLWTQTEKLFYWLSSRWWDSYKNECRAAGLELDDLNQIAFFALLDAVNAFDKTKGFKFATYCNHALKNCFKKAMGLRSSKIEPLNTTVSVDAALSADNENLTLLDLVEDTSATEAFDCIQDTVYCEQLRRTLDTAINKKCNAQQAAIIQMHYFGNKTFREISAGTSVSPDRVRVIHNEGLRQLRKSRELNAFVEEYTHAKAYQHTGLSSFRNTGGSSVELIYEKLEHMRERAAIRSQDKPDNLNALQK